MKYRIIEPARPHPSFGNVERIERYRDGAGITPGLFYHLYTLKRLACSATDHVSDFVKAMGLYPLDPRAGKLITDEGRIQGVTLTHPYWQGSAYLVEIGGIVTTIEPSYLSAWIYPQPPAIGGREWKDDKGTSLPKPPSVRVRLDLDFTEDRDPEADVMALLDLTMEALVELGLAERAAERVDECSFGQEETP